ncbi:hypothetical protein MMC08_008121 [Hypocenomyce scalaris]|nr:hypothetical protein [Hypocenomyce scalaris]
MSLATLATFLLLQGSLASLAENWFSTPQSHKHIIYNVKIFDGERLVPQDRVVISGGIIVPDADTDEATQEDGKGAFLLPGFFDCHVHVSGPPALETFRDYGVTTALDMGSSSYQKNIASLRPMSSKGYPAIYSASAAASKAGGFLSKRPGHPTDAYINTSMDAVSFVQNRKAEGADYIKIFINETSGPDVNLQRVIVGSANSEDLQVVSHATSTTAYDQAADAGGLFITHAPRNQKLDGATVQKLSLNGQISIPTLVQMRNLLRAFHATANYTYSRDSVTALYDAGVPILVGTDATDGHMFVTYHGSLQDEMELLVEAQVSAIDVLRGATSLPAKHFGLTDRGRIAAGMRADMVLLGGDPLANISKTREVLKVWIGGVESAPRGAEAGQYGMQWPFAGPSLEISEEELKA